MAGTVLHVGGHAPGQGQDGLHEPGVVQGLQAVEAAEQGVLFGQGGGHLGRKQLLVQEVARADADARGLVLVAGADAPARGADLGAGLGRLAGGVQQVVVGQDHVGAVAHGQPGRGHVHALGREPVGLGQEHRRVQHHARADHATLARVQDARGNEVQHGLLAVHHQGVARVVAAVEPYDEVRPFGEQVHDLALAFVAPLGAVHHHASH